MACFRKRITALGMCHVHTVYDAIEHCHSDDCLDVARKRAHLSASPLLANILPGAETASPEVAGGGGGWVESARIFDILDPHPNHTSRGDLGPRCRGSTTTVVTVEDPADPGAAMAPRGRW